MKIPCKKDCPRRSATCHAECEDYLAFVEDTRQRREQRRLKRITDGYVTKEVRKAKASSRKWKGRK